MCGSNAINKEGRTVTMPQAVANVKSGSGPTFPSYDILRRFRFNIAPGAMPKSYYSKESAPPVQRSAPSSSGGPTSLGIRRSSSARKRNITSGRSGSKSKRFSTTR